MHEQWRDEPLRVVESELKRLYVKGKRYVKAKDISVGLSAVQVGKLLKEISQRSSAVVLSLHSAPNNNSPNVWEIRKIRGLPH